MRHLVVCVVAGLLALPQTVAAQVANEVSTSKQVSTAWHVHAYPRLPPQLMLRASHYLVSTRPSTRGRASTYTHAVDHVKRVLEAVHGLS
jgi:hypothetical protein